jgi:siderophore synthetase component
MSIQCFLNSYLRETQKGKRVDKNSIELYKFPSKVFTSENMTDGLLLILEPYGIELFIGLEYFSLTGHHLLCFPILTKSKQGQWQETSLETLAILCLNDIRSSEVSETDNDSNTIDLLSRLFKSFNNMDQFIKLRKNEFHLASNTRYLEAEQSLLIGHQMHPLPKSREGFNAADLMKYAPESLEGFQLHYLLADSSIVLSDSALEWDAKTLIERELKSYDQLPDKIANALEKQPDAVLIPMHPWQVEHIKTLDKIKPLFNDLLLQDLGPAGPLFHPTSSVRTVACNESQFQYKFSMNITITNSLRTNLFKELLRGVEFMNLWKHKSEEIKRTCPSFETLNDPAYLTLHINGEPIDEVSVILRQNIFNSAALNDWDNNQADADVTALASLCQDNPYESGNRLSHIFSTIVQTEKISKEQAAEKWFDRFLTVAVAPMLYLYREYGMAFEAHQQNTLLQLEGGYPSTFYYRDNQGTGDIDEWCNSLRSDLPEIGIKTECLVPLDLVDHHYTYYFLINNILGLVNAIGCTRMIAEEVLLKQLKLFISEQKSSFDNDFPLLDFWLNSDALPCKGNLMTRVAGLDELIAPLDAQSIYFALPNPLKLV